MYDGTFQPPITSLGKVRKEERAAIWAWPILVIAFIISGAIQFLLSFIGLFRRSPK